MEIYKVVVSRSLLTLFQANNVINTNREDLHKTI